MSADSTVALMAARWVVQKAARTVGPKAAVLVALLGDKMVALKAEN